MNDLKDWHSRIALLALLFIMMSGYTWAAFMAANLPTYLDNIAGVHDRAYGPESLQKLDIYIPWRYLKGWRMWLGTPGD